VTVAWSVLCWGTAAHAQGPSAAELRTLSLEELGNLVVTSVSKGEERLSRAAAAVSIITNDDIRRSGATTIAEVLRLAPGLHVARQTSNIWAVSSRGFSSQNSEKLLVQTDTRSIYTPLFAGVLWDVQDVLIEDVERIEVIRGPGAALWGSNAVNGVINITTKSARDTQGLYVSTAAGSEERFAVNARYGGRVGNRAYYRVFGKFSDHGGSFTTSTMQQDDWQLGHGGARVDWLATDADTVTMQGHVYGGDIGRLFPAISLGPTGPAPAGLLRTDVGGGNVLARWTRRSSPGSDLQVRVYYDRTRRNDPNFIDELDTFDADFQHRSAFPRRQELTWGANYRSMSNRNEGKVIFALEPASSAEQVYSGFVQHQIELADSVRLTTGTKLEHNDFSGGEIQPSGRVAWRPRAAHTVWGAVSRAVRIPTRLERDVAINVTPPMSSIWVRLLGNPEFDSERLVAVEAAAGRSRGVPQPLPRPRVARARRAVPRLRPDRRTNRQREPDERPCAGIRSGDQHRAGAMVAVVHHVHHDAARPDSEWYRSESRRPAGRGHAAPSARHPLAAGSRRERRRRRPLSPFDRNPASAGAP
jgi:iron complex outermembrane receptor protein